MRVLIVNGGLYQNQHINIEGDRLTIGRSLEADLILKNKRVSSFHAQILKRENDFWLQDLGSTNGTYLRKRQIIQHCLSLGDEFFIADFKLTFSAHAHIPEATHEESLDDLRRSLHALLISELNLKQVTVDQMEDESLRRQASEVLERLLESREKEIPCKYDHDEVKKAVLDAALGLGPLEDLIKDHSVSEVMVNAPDRIYIEKDGRLQLSSTSFFGKTEVMTAIERIVAPIGRRIDESSPMVDARLSDGSRVNAIISPLALDCPTLTIRKFPHKRMTKNDLLALNSLTPAMADFIRLCAQSKRNVLISGGTGSGKTTLLNVVSSDIFDGERIITIEDAAELQLPQEHVVRLETRPPNIEGKGAVTIRDLVRNALRMRPDRIIVGECRGEETFDMLQAMNTGHDGSLTTVHANSPADALRRIESMVLMSNIGLPLAAVRELVLSAIHIVIQISRFSDGTRKIVCISEVSRICDQEIQLGNLFEYKRVGLNEEGVIDGYHTATGIIPSFADDLREAGVRLDMSIFVPSKGD